MLQETIYERKNVGQLKLGFYFIKTSRAVWDRVQIVELTRSCVRIFYVGVEHVRIRRHGRTYYRTRRIRCVKSLPIKWIVEARPYTL